MLDMNSAANNTVEISEMGCSETTTVRAIAREARRIANATGRCVNVMCNGKVIDVVPPRF